MKSAKSKPKTDAVSEKDGVDVVSEKDVVSEGESVKDGERGRGQLPPSRERSRSRSEGREGREENAGQGDRIGRVLRSGSRASREISAESHQALIDEPCEEIEMASGSDTSVRSLRVVLDRLPRTYSRSQTDASRLERKRTMSESSNDDSHPQTKVSTTSRGRGRPLTTGEYVGLAKAKQALIDLEHEELRLQAEKEVAEMAKEHRARARSLSLSSAPDIDLDEETAAALREQVQKSLELILHVAAKSANLKGTFVRGLKDAASSIKGAVSKLSLRTATEENSRLEAENKRLKTEMANFQRQLEEIKKEQANMRLSREAERPTTTTTKSSISDEDMRRIMVEVGTMMNARFAANEVQRTRPPLAADKAPSVPATSQLDEPTQRPATSEPRSKSKRKKGRKTTKVVANDGAISAPGPSTQPQTTNTPPAEGEWVKVVKRGKKTATKDATPAGRATKAQEPKKVPKVRTPRTTAVVVTIQPGGERKGLTYADVIKEAKNKIDLPSLGISAGIKLRSAATGARIFELPGAASSAQADTLAAKIREVFDEEDIKVSRPTKCSELRIAGLDDSISEEEVAAAIAKETGCAADTIKVGIIRRNASGFGSVWARCPVAEAKKLEAKGKILVGWVAARVKMLQPRLQRCFRCQETGHFRCKCTSAVDRSDLCYRCGLAGHKAVTCEAAPNCSLCQAAGRPAGHRVGSKACTPPRSKAKGGQQPARVPAPEAMEDAGEGPVSDPTCSRENGAQ